MLLEKIHEIKQQYYDLWSMINRIKTNWIFVLDMLFSKFLPFPVSYAQRNTDIYFVYL